MGESYKSLNLYHLYCTTQMLFVCDSVSECCWNVWCMCRWSVTSIGSGWPERCGRRDGLPWWWGMLLLPSKVECLGPRGGAGACISRPLPVWLAVEKRGKALNGHNEGNISTQNDPEFTRFRVQLQWGKHFKNNYIYLINWNIRQNNRQNK